MACDENLAGRVREVLGKRPAVEEKKMFGGLAFMVRGSMSCGISGSRLMARIGRENYDEVLSEEHVLPMDFTGRPLKGFVYVEAEGLESDSALESRVDRCLTFVDTLPPK